MEIIVTKGDIRKLQRDIDNTDVRIRIVDDLPSDEHSQVEVTQADSPSPQTQARSGQ